MLGISGGAVYLPGRLDSHRFRGFRRMEGLIVSCALLLENLIPEVSIGFVMD